MTLRNPGFAWLALLLVVPLILYLLPMPRRRIAAAAVYLWRQFLKAEPFGGASDRLRRAVGFTLLVTILICLILAAADLAVGRASVDARKVVVLVDASAGMNALRDGKANLERAKDAAAALIESLPGGAEVAVVEVADRLNVAAPLGATPADAVRAVRQVEPSDAPADMGRALADAHRLWGADADVQLHAFTDAPLPTDGPWGGRAHAWVAPPAGDNAAVIAVAARRRGDEVTVRFTLANYGETARALAGTVVCNGVPVRSFDAGAIGPGASAERIVRFDEAAAAFVEVRLDSTGDVLAADDAARIAVPPVKSLGVRVVWPEGQRPNAYVSAVLGALKDEGVLDVLPAGAASAPVTVYVNHLPEAWPEGGAIVLYPLRSGAVKVAGLAGEAVTVSRQARHPLLEGVDLRGLVVKGAVRTEVPDWAEPIVWAGDLPVVWAGATGKVFGRGDASDAATPPAPPREQKVLLVAVPLNPAGSRLPMAAAFPVLMRNAMQWMLPGAEALRPGDRVQGWTRRWAGFARRPGERMSRAFSVLSAAESDLRRPDAAEPPRFAPRQSLAAVLVAIAAVLLLAEWALFHKRLTE